MTMEHPITGRTRIHASFRATLQRSPSKGGWTYVSDGGFRPVLQDPQTRKGEGDAATTCPTTATFMALGDGTQKLPLKASLWKQISKEAGDEVSRRHSRSSSPET